jgi:hypothetical protein
MKRFWPRTLSGQLILVMLLAVALSQAVTLAIYRLERARALRSVIGEEFLGRAVSAYRLAEGTSASRRTETLKAIETPLTRYWITDAPVPSSTEWQRQAREHLLQPTSASGRHSSTSSMFLHEPMLGRMTHEPWKVLPEGTWLLPQPIQLLDLE